MSIVQILMTALADYLLGPVSRAAVLVADDDALLVLDGRLGRHN